MAATIFASLGSSANAAINDNTHSPQGTRLGTSQDDRQELRYERMFEPAMHRRADRGEFVDGIEKHTKKQPRAVKASKSYVDEA